MILAGLVAPSITFDEWDLIEQCDTDELRALERWTSFSYRAPEVVPYLEILVVNGLGRRGYVVRPMVPCVTALP